jgi:integrase
VCQCILAACEKKENRYASALFKLALLTGRRIGELRNAHWEDVSTYHDDEGNLHIRLSIPQTKAGERQYVF